MINFEQLKKELEKINNEPSRRRSAWGRGVGAYAVELVEELEEHGEELATNSKDLERQMLNGAQDWAQFSWGGCSLIYNGDICERLATPSEQKRTNNGEKEPNAQEDWLDVQARALYQAAFRVRAAVKNLQNNL